MKGLKVVVTYKCNFMCSNCRYSCTPYKKGAMDVQKFKREVCQAMDEGYNNYVIIDGGEYFISGGLVFKYLKSIDKINIKKSIVTNASWGKKELFNYTLQSLKKCGLDEIIIKYDYFHSPFTDADTIKESIKKSIKMDFKVAICSTFESESVNTSKDIYTYNFIKDINENFSDIKFIFESTEAYKSPSLSHRYISKNEKVVLY